MQNSSHGPAATPQHLQWKLAYTKWVNKEDEFSNHKQYPGDISDSWKSYCPWGAWFLCSKTAILFQSLNEEILGSPSQDTPGQKPTAFLKAGSLFILYSSH